MRHASEILSLWKQSEARIPEPSCSSQDSSGGEEVQMPSRRSRPCSQCPVFIGTPATIQLSPVIIHVLNLPLHIAVDALAVGPVCQLPHHPQAVRPLLLGEKLPDRHGDALPSLLRADAHHLLPQSDFGLCQAPVLLFPPASLQWTGIKSGTTVVPFFRMFLSAMD